MEGQKTGKSLSTIIGRMLPQFVLDDHKNFVTFIQKYFEYLEQDLKSYDLIANALIYADIDETIDDFIERFRRQYTDEIPRKFSFLESTSDVKGDIRLIIKKIRDYYLTKGSELSYEFLFSIIYGVAVEFYYPKVDILRCSDGKWYVPYYLIPTTTPNNIVYEDVFIRGRTSGARGYLDSFILTEYPIDSGNSRTTANITDVVGSFQNGEEVEIIGNETEFFTVEATGGVQIGEGRWLGTDGFLSFDKFLQDNDYYQEYSYELRTSLSRDLYENLIKEIVHPAGLKLFGKVVVDIVSFLNDQQSYETWKIEWEEQTSIANNVSVINEMKHYYEDDHFNSIKSDTWLSVEEDITSGSGFFSNMTFADLSSYTEQMFINNSNENSSLVFVNGQKINGYLIGKKSINIPSAYTQYDRLRIFGLGNRSSARIELQGNGAASSFNLGSTFNINNILVFVDGIKQRPIHDCYISGTDLIFTYVPIALAKIEIYTYSKHTNPQIFSGNGLDREVVLSKKVFRNDKDSILAFVDGYLVTAAINNNKVLFKDPPSNGANNIEIVSFNRVAEANEEYILDGTSTVFTIENVPNPFRYSIGSDVTII